MPSEVPEDWVVSWVTGIWNLPKFGWCGVKTYFARFRRQENGVAKPEEPAGEELFITDFWGSGMCSGHGCVDRLPGEAKLQMTVLYCGEMLPLSREEMECLWLRLATRQQ